MYLIQEKQVKSKKLGMMYFRMPSLESLDNLIYKAVAVGFPLFTMGFLTGTIWNIKKSQSSLFSFDLAAIWPLIIGWILYGLVFFGRYRMGWRGKRVAQGSVIGFITVMLSILLHV
jgi:ABC-type uncharacterized transport system permease subunit